MIVWLYIVPMMDEAICNKITNFFMLYWHVAIGDTGISRKLGNEILPITSACAWVNSSNNHRIVYMYVFLAERF